MTFKNKNFTTRNYECSNVVFCQSESSPGENWIECDESEITENNTTQLYSETIGRGIGVEPQRVTYFGWM